MIPEIFGEDTRMGRMLWWLNGTMFNIISIITSKMMDPGIDPKNYTLEGYLYLLGDHYLSGMNGVILVLFGLLACYASYCIDMARARDCEAGMLTFGAIYLYHALSIVMLMIFIMLMSDSTGTSIFLTLTVIALVNIVCWIWLVIVLGFFGSRRTSDYYY